MIMGKFGGVMIVLFHLILAPAALMSKNPTPTYLLLLLDSSGSMKKTDPYNIRKLASQAIVTVLPQNTKVSVVEFDSDARILAKWLSVSQREDLFRAINKVGNKGYFTDFRAGIEEALQLFKGVPENSQKVILLLSDGIMEPNPYSSDYPPYNLEFRRAVFGKSKREMMEIYREEFWEKFLLVANRIINNQTIPACRQENVEIYTIAFSPQSDKKFLENLSRKTSKTPGEYHSYYAEKASDLVEAFLGFLTYWENMMVVKKEDGVVEPGYKNSIYVDEYLKNPMLVLFTDNPSEFWVKPGKNLNIFETPIYDTHPDLKIIPLKSYPPPGDWFYGFNRGRGNYKLIFVAKSSISLDVYGLKRVYQYGEPVKGMVKPTLKGKSVLEFLKSANLTMTITHGKKSFSTNLEKEGEGFKVYYNPSEVGFYKIHFVLTGKDGYNRDIIPRPSKDYEFDVKPSFYVEPKYIDFGDLKRGQTVEKTITIHWGVPTSGVLTVETSVSKGTRCTKYPEKLPKFEFTKVSLPRTGVYKKTIKVQVPPKGCWGDFEGVFNFRCNEFNDDVKYHIHVTSFYEKLPIVISTLLILFAVVIGGMITYWGMQKPPVGVLKIIKYPSGELLPDHYILRNLKSGFLDRWLKLNRNIIIIGDRKADLRLGMCPPGTRIKLIFHRLIKDQIKNESKTKEAMEKIQVYDPYIGKWMPLRTNPLVHGLRFKIGDDYEFVYENLNLKGGI